MSTNLIMQRIREAGGLSQEDTTVTVVPTPTEDNGAAAAVTPDTGEAGSDNISTAPVTTPEEGVSTAPVVVDPEDNDEIVVIEDPDDVDDEKADADEDEIVDDEIEQLRALDDENEELYQLTMFREAVSQFGMSPSTQALGQITGLLAGTSIETVGCESFADGSEASTQMGCEALSGAILKGAEKLGQGALEHASLWSSKMLGVVTSASERVAGLTFKVKGAAAGVAKMAGNHIDDIRGGMKYPGLKGLVNGKGGTVFARDMIHSPVAKAASKFGGAKTAMLVAGAIAAVAGVTAVAMRNAPKATASAAEQAGWFNKIRQAVAGIKWPFGKLTVEPEKGATGIRAQLGKLFCGGKPAKSAEASASGFIGKAGALTKEAFESVKSAVLRSVEAVKHAITSVGASIKSLFGGASGAGSLKDLAKGSAATAGKDAGAGAASLLSRAGRIAGIGAVLALLTGLVYFVVVGGLRIVRRILSHDEG